MAALALLAVSFSVATADQEATVRLAPAELDLKPGDTARVQVRIENASGTYGYQFSLHFDPAALEVVDADPARDGLQIGQGEFLGDPSFVAINRADNAAGKIDYVATLLGPVEGRGGGGTLATITFRAKAAGRAVPRFGDLKLAARDSSSLQVAVEGQRLPTPTAAPPRPTTPPVPAATAVAARPAAAPAAPAPTRPAGAAAPSAAPSPTPPPAAVRSTQPTPTAVPVAPAAQPPPQEAEGSSLPAVLAVLALVVAVGGLSARRFLGGGRRSR